MRKADITRRIADEMELTYVKAEEAIEAVLDEIKQTLQNGESVILRRFGTFEVRAKRSRMGRNPKTGDAATIAARRVVRFKAGNRLRQAANGWVTASTDR
jgi:nucleoid DNA-binding protein